jgi:heme exporter protein D
VSSNALRSLTAKDVNQKKKIKKNNKKKKQREKQIALNEEESFIN